MSTRNSIQLADIAPGIMDAPFIDATDHTTLGAEMNVATDFTPETAYGLEGLPVGTKLFIKSEQEELKADPTYDAVGMILGHDREKVQLISLTPKDGVSWGVHNAYGEPASDIADAFAALDRLFDPKVEFGSIAVLSETTGLLLQEGSSSTTGEASSPTIGLAGCNSHEKTRLGQTLNFSQLLDTYRLRPIALLPDSDIVRRDSDGIIIHWLPGKPHSEQPSREQRDQRSMLDRIHRLTTSRQSALVGEAPATVLRSITDTILSGSFADIERPVSSVASEIKKRAERIVA